MLVVMRMFDKFEESKGDTHCGFIVVFTTSARSYKLFLETLP